MGAWHFAGIPKNVSTAIKALNTGPRRGFGSVPVRVTLGKTTWEIAIFPDSHSGCYLLPLKAKVRTAEEVLAGDSIDLSITIR